MSDDSLRAASDRVTEAFAAAIKAGEIGDSQSGMPGSWVLIGSYYDDQGSSQCVFLAGNDDRLGETLGLLQLGSIHWTEQGRRWVCEE